jgi:phycobilisome core-membrane linker protein
VANTTIIPLPAAGVGTALGDWRPSISSEVATADAQQPGAAMARALRPAAPQGFARRQSLGRPVQLLAFPSEGQVKEAIDATYRQLLNRVPLVAERLTDAESQFRDGQLSVAEFVAQVSISPLFLRRLERMAPLRAASAAYLALLGRAGQPAEVSRFLATRVRSGMQAAIQHLLDGAEYAAAFG